MLLSYLLVKILYTSIMSPVARIFVGRVQLYKRAVACAQLIIYSMLGVYSWQFAIYHCHDSSRWP